MDTSLLGMSELTPEKVALMKLEASADFDHSFLSEPATPNEKRKSLGFSGLSNGSSHRSSLARTSRQVSNSSRRSSSFLNSHRNKMSMELTTQAESKFFALMELMAGASREASSLKDYWGRLIADRESFSREREELMLQIDEVSETLQETQEQHHDHSYELSERKKEVDKLRLELTAALTGIADQRKKVGERDGELERVRQELSDFRLTLSRSHMEHESVKAEVDSLRLKLTTAESERDHARENSDRYHSDFRSLTREHTELKSKHTDLLTRLDAARKDVLSLTDRIKIWELEREEQLHERDHLHEELRKARARADDATRELTELTERHDKATRETTKLRESLRSLETERDELAHTLEHVRRELKTKITTCDESEARVAEITLKYEHIKREVVSIKEKLREAESGAAEVRSSLERRHEEYRLLAVERDQLRDDVDAERSRVLDVSRQLTALQDAHSRADSVLVDVRAELFTASERAKALERERDDSRDKHGVLTAELATLRERIVLFQAEIRTLTDARDRLRLEMHEYKGKYEEISETVTDFQDGSGELEFEVESLRALLREAREQKERAIAARIAADRERDAFLAKYEEKCREMERYEEESARLFHMHGRESSRTTSTRRVVSRNGASSSSAKHEAHVEG